MGADWWGSNKACIRWGPDPPTRRGIFEGTCWTIVMYLLRANVPAERMRRTNTFTLHLFNFAGVSFVSWVSFRVLGRAWLVQKEALLDSEKQLGKTLGWKGQFLIFVNYLLLLTFACKCVSAPRFSYACPCHMSTNVILYFLLFVVYWSNVPCLPVSLAVEHKLIFYTYVVFCHL